MRQQAMIIHLYLMVYTKHLCSNWGLCVHFRFTSISPWKTKMFVRNIIIYDLHVPSGKRLHNYGQSLFLAGKLTISMTIFAV